MIRKILALLLFLPVSICAAKNQGIESPNFEGSIAYSDMNYWERYSLGITANLPVTDKLGSNISALYQSINGKEYKGGRGYDSTTTGVFATLFISDQSIGKAGALINYAKSEHDYPASLASFENQETTGYGIFGTYYLNNFSIFASRSYSENNNDSSIYISNFGVAYYILANTGVSLSGLRVNQETDYDLTITHQPSFLDNNVALTFTYDRDSEDRDFDSYTLSFNYYFGTRVSLINRDRKYR